MGWLRRVQNRLIDSQIELEQAIALDRNFGAAMLQLGWTLNELGQPETALPHIEKAILLVPRNQSMYAHYAALGQGHLLLGHTDQAVDFLRKARAANSRVYYVHLFLAAALGLRGDVDEAKAALADMLKLKPDLNSFAKLRAASNGHYNNPQYRALAEKTEEIGLRRAGLTEE